MMAWLLVFAVYFGLDFVWARYNAACADRRKWPACWYATAIVFFAGTAQVFYVNEPWLLAPAAAGAFAGTWASFCKPLTMLGGK